MSRALSFAIVFCLGETVSSAVRAEGAERPLLSRHDLGKLRTYDRTQVFAVFGSFDGRDLSEPEFVLQAAGLLDPDSVPGLAEARVAGDAQNVLQVIHDACRGAHKQPARERVSPSRLAAADALLENRFSFYGEVHQLPGNINWDWNPGTGHWGHDLNRFSYLATLTKAYLGTDDERYSRKAVALILDWISKCDVSKCFKGTPYVWGSYLNNTIHCKEWCSCLATLIACDQVTPIEMLRVLKSVHDQLAYLEVVTNQHAGNWPTIGCQGMLGCLEAFPVFRDRDRFATYCMKTLTAQIADQVLPDGVQDELTPHYHRVVINNLLSAIRSLRTIGRGLAPETVDVLRKMMHYAQQTTMPDGSKQAGFNDSDPGRPSDYRRALTKLGLVDLLSPPAKLGPEVFPHAGVAFLRQRQDQGDLYLAFDAGPFGRGHQHEDKLGFWLFAYGRNFLVDPGRHLYDNSPASFRGYLTSTKAHSTIRIDGQDQCSRSRRDTWIAKKPLDLGWQTSENEVRARGVYDLGYGPKNDMTVIHRREIVLVGQRFWVVFDVVEGEGEHLIESRFQFAPGEVILDGTEAHTDFRDANLLLRAEAAVPFEDTHIEKGQTNPRGGWYSDSYGKIEPAPALSLSVRTQLPWRTATLLFPYRSQAVPAVSLVFENRHAEIEHPETGRITVQCSLP